MEKQNSTSTQEATHSPFKSIFSLNGNHFPILLHTVSLLPFFEFYINRIIS